MIRIDKFLMVIFSLQLCGCNGSAEKAHTEETVPADTVWVPKNIGSFSIKIPIDYKLQFLNNDSVNGILSNNHIQVNFATGYSRLFFEKRPQEVTIDLDTNQTVIVRITKFRLNGAVTLAMEAWDTSKNTGNIFEDLRVEGITMDASNLNKVQEDTLIEIFKSLKGLPK